MWPSDTIWWHSSVSKLDQVMACCLTAPSHYLNQCWLFINKAHWHLAESNFTHTVPDITHNQVFKNFIFGNTCTVSTPNDQWVTLWWPERSFKNIQTALFNHFCTMLKAYPTQDCLVSSLNVIRREIGRNHSSGQRIPETNIIASMIIHSQAASSLAYHLPPPLPPPPPPPLSSTNYKQHHCHYTEKRAFEIW